MKKYVFYLLLGCLSLSMTSCDLETSDNGELDGLWQLASVDTLATDGHTDLRERNVCWAVQGKLLELKRADIWYICKFSNENGFLTLGTLHFVERDAGDPEVVDDNSDELDDKYKLEALRPYGINALEESFRIEKLNSSTMVLESTLLRLNFRKY